VSDDERGARYVSEYSTKGIGRELTRWPDRLIEAIRAVKGSRLIATFGSWWGMDVEEEKEEKTEWVARFSLPAVVLAATQGEPWAVALMLALRRVVCLRGGAIRYTRPRRVSEGPIAIV
jgi:hypothetical protein